MFRRQNVLATVIFGLRRREDERNFTIEEGWYENSRCLRTELEFRPLVNLSCGKGLSSLIFFSVVEPKAKMHLWQKTEQGP